MTKSEEEVHNDNNKIAEYQSHVLVKHGLQSAGFSFPCIYPNCTEKFRFTKTLTSHLRTGHNDNIGARCPYCGTEWHTLYNLMLHVRSHTRHRSYVCPFFGCSYAAGSKGQLDDHLQSRIHQLSTFLFSDTFTYSSIILYIH